MPAQRKEWGADGGKPVDGRVEHETGESLQGWNSKDAIRKDL